MKTANRAMLSVFFVFAAVTLASCDAKKKETEQVPPSAAGTASTAGNPAAAAATAAPVAGNSTAANATTSPTAEARLAKLGFHVFPSPQPLPDFSLPALGGSKSGDAPLTSASLAGTVTLFNFWATWCPPCKSEMPSIQKLQGEMHGTAFRIAAISVGENAKTVSDFIAKAGYTFPVYLDSNGSLGQIFASQGIPTTYILDKTGKAIAGMVGANEYDNPELIAILKELAAR